MPSRKRKLLHSHHGKNFLEVVDQEQYRSLFFQDAVVQSRIALKDPGRLVLRYTQYMMAASLLAHPRPNRILLIGVGAGALLHFIYRYLPECRVEAVDYSSHIIQVARTFFAVPENDRITIHCEDGLSYLQKLNREHRFDLILLDAFNSTGMAGNIYSSEFFRLAGERISENGVLCGNLWSGNYDMYNSVKKAILKHSESSLFIPVRKRENIIALLFRHPVPWRLICPSAADLRVLGEQYNLNFAEVSAAAEKSNMRLAERLQHWFKGR